MLELLPLYGVERGLSTGGGWKGVSERAFYNRDTPCRGGPMCPPFYGKRPGSGKRADTQVRPYIGSLRGTGGPGGPPLRLRLSMAVSVWDGRRPVFSGGCVSGGTGGPGGPPLRLRLSMAVSVWGRAAARFFGGAVFPGGRAAGSRPYVLFIDGLFCVGRAGQKKGPFGKGPCPEGGGCYFPMMVPSSWRVSVSFAMRKSRKPSSVTAPPALSSTEDR